MRKTLICLYLLVALALLGGCGASVALQYPTPSPTERGQAGSRSESTSSPSGTTATPPAPTTEPTTMPTATTAQPATETAMTASWSRPLQVQEPRILGADVEQVQRRLLELGYGLVGEPDGIYGPQTELAVTIFQARHGLAVGAGVDQATWTQLFDAAAQGPEPALPVLALGAGSSNVQLLGGSQQGVWLTAEQIAPLIPAGERYTMYGLDAAQGDVAGGAPSRLEDIPCHTTYTVGLAEEAPAGALVAVHAAVKAQPRVATEGDVNSTAYRQALAQLLREQGITHDEPELTQALLVDVEGDGSQEVLVSATRHEDGMMPHAAAGDYSLVALLRRAGDTLRPTLVKGDFYPAANEFAAPLTVRVDALLDLNGDGTLEILLGESWWEGGGMSAFTVEQGGVRDTGLRYSCGV